MQKARVSAYCSAPLVGTGFRYYFTLHVRSAFHLSLTELYTISLSGVFSLPVANGRFTRISRVPRYSGLHYLRLACVPELFPCGILFQNVSAQDAMQHHGHDPEDAVTTAVWVLPRSLATTGGIIVIFFSCGY